MLMILTITMIIDENGGDAEMMIVNYSDVDNELCPENGSDISQRWIVWQHLLKRLQINAVQIQASARSRKPLQTSSYTIYSMLVHTANGSTGAEGTCLETKLPSVPANLL